MPVKYFVLYLYLFLKGNFNYLFLDKEQVDDRINNLIIAK